MEIVTRFEATPSIMVGKDDYAERHYETPSLEGCSIREVHVQNRFPVEKYALNRDCNIFIRVLKGYELTLVTLNGDSMVSKKGECFEIPKGTAYYILVNPVAILEVVSTPPWNEEQLILVTP